jgi:hypothetical protein
MTRAQSAPRVPGWYYFALKLWGFEHFPFRHSLKLNHKTHFIWQLPSVSLTVWTAS